MPSTAVLAAALTAQTRNPSSAISSGAYNLCLDTMPDTLTAIPPDTWDSFAARHRHAHLLQTSPWGGLKAQFGWSDERVGVTKHGELVAGAQILYKRLPGALGTLAYVPKGPLVDWDDEEQLATLLPVIDCAIRERGAIALTIEPELPDEPIHHRKLTGLGLHPSPLGSVQPRRTIVVDISLDQDGVLKAMKQKTRYNIRLAGRKGVTVREATKDDLPILHALMAATAERDRFGVHAPAYYDAAFELFVPRGWARLLLAETEGEAVAAVMVFAVPPRAWYLYGASSNSHREKMPTYLLQWEAMRWAMEEGCTSYDLYGVPDEDEETLEEQFTRRSEELWGVYRFKRGFGGRLVRSVGAWDRVYAPLRYELYRQMVTIRSRVLS